MKTTKTLIAVFVTVIFFSAAKVNAQSVAINSNGDQAAASSMLDITSTTKGMLIPRVALTSTSTAAPVSSPAQSLLVFNTNSAGDVVPGYYYWDGTSKWVALSTNSWSKNGNSGTTAGTNFIGSTDAVDVVIKSSNAEVLRATTEGNVEVSGQVYSPKYTIP